MDGNTLLPLWEDSDAEAIFIAPVPNSLGFNKIMFCERLKSEMACRLAYNNSLSLRFLSGKQGLPIARRTVWGPRVSIANGCVFMVPRAPSRVGDTGSTSRGRGESGVPTPEATKPSIAGSFPKETGMFVATFLKEPFHGPGGWNTAPETHVHRARGGRGSSMPRLCARGPSWPNSARAVPVFPNVTSTPVFPVGPRVPEICSLQRL